MGAQLASCRLLGNSEHKLQKYGQLWCDVVLQFSGRDCFNPPARPLPKSMGAALSSANFSEFDLPLDKKVGRFTFCRIDWCRQFQVTRFEQGEELYGCLKAIRAHIACETNAAACVGPTCPQLALHLFIMQCRRRTGSFSSFYSALQALVCAAGVSTSNDHRSCCD